MDIEVEGTSGEQSRRAFIGRMAAVSGALAVPVVASFALRGGSPAGLDAGGRYTGGSNSSNGGVIIVFPTLPGDPTTTAAPTTTTGATAVPTVPTTQPETTPTLVSVPSAPVDSDIPVSGINMPANADVAIELHSRVTILGTVRSRDDGTYQGTVHVPASATLGMHQLVARSGAKSATTAIELTTARQIPPTK